MSRRGHKKHEEHSEGEAWLLPYSDLMTLLLAVFIVLFAVNATSESAAKSEAMAQAFRDIILPGGSSIIESGNNSVSPIDGGGLLMTPEEMEAARAADEVVASIHRLKQIQGDLETYFQQQSIEESVSTRMEDGELIITITDSPSGSIMFDSGSAHVKAENEDILISIGNTIGNLNATIRVEGHTDDRPIRTALYPSNWELSGARAASVIRIFAEKCGLDPSRMATMGYGEFKPVADNSTAEGRASNRRVEILVSSSTSETDQQTNFGLPPIDEEEPEDLIEE